MAVLVLFAAGCSSVKQTEKEAPKPVVTTEADNRASDSARRSYIETILAQQTEMLERQRESISELQQQQQQLQKQLSELTATVNKNNAAAARLSVPVLSSDKTEKMASSPQIDSSGKLILGQYEWAWFDLFGDSVSARMDTGAKFSKLFVTDVQIFERNGANWVRFTVSSQWQGETNTSDRTFESPLVRKVKVKATATTPIRHRPVIKLTTKVGVIVEDIEFVLHQKTTNNDLSPALLGRTFVRDIAVVDVAQHHTQKKFTKAESP